MTLLIGIAIGAYFVLSGNIDTLKKPFYESMSKYNPNGKSSEDRTLVQMWDDWQQSVRLDPIQHLECNEIPFVYETLILRLVKNVTKLA